MASDSLADAWLRLWSPTINLPGSGSLGQFTYQPYTNWGAPSLFSGNQAVEERVYREVGTPGRQLGKLTDALLELADALAQREPALAELPALTALRALDTEVKTIKNSVEDNTAKRAKAALDELQSADPRALARLLEEYGKANTS